MTTRAKLSVTFIHILTLFFVSMMEDALDQRVVFVINRQNSARKRKELVVSSSCKVSANFPTEA